MSDFIKLLKEIHQLNDDGSCMVCKEVNLIEIRVDNICRLQCRNCLTVANLTNKDTED